MRFLCFCENNLFLTEDNLSLLAEKSLKSLTDSIIGMVVKRQQYANLSWFNFDLSSADETFTISKASLIQESMFALSQEKASLHRPI